LISEDYYLLIFILIGTLLLVSSTSIIHALNIKQTSESNFKTKIMFAETLFVDNEGDGDYDSIQAAINAASSGDIIKVYSGKYNENRHKYFKEAVG